MHAKLLAFHKADEPRPQYLWSRLGHPRRTGWTNSDNGDLPKVSSDANKRIRGQRERWRRLNRWFGRQKVALGDLTVGGPAGWADDEDGVTTRPLTVVAGGRRRMAPRTGSGTTVLWSRFLLSLLKRRDSLQHQALSRLPHVFLLDWHREGG